MARATKRGTCELCGVHANVGMNHGSKVCTNCTHVQSALSKRPQSVANAIRAMGKTEEMLGHLIPAGGLAVKVTADLLQEISGIVGYQGEDPQGLVEAVRRVASGGAQQLTSEAEAGALRTIAGIVGYGGTDGEELVEAVRKRVLTCASCDAEDVLHEIREIVGYTPEQEDRGLADAVRWLQAKASSAMDCTALRSDLLRACGLEMDDTEDGEGWDVAAAAAIQTIAALENLTAAREENARLCTMINARHSESEQVTALRDDLSRSSEVIEQLRAELTLAQQSRDEWEQLAVEAKDNVESLESELRNREDAPAAPCASTTYLLDIALCALRGEGPDADQLATIIDAARRAA